MNHVSRKKSTIGAAVKVLGDISVAPDKQEHCTSFFSDLFEVFEIFISVDLPQPV